MIKLYGLQTGSEIVIIYYGNEITWSPELEKSAKPLYISLAESIEKDIENGKLKSGFKLPAQRIIADYLGINHSTVTRAYKLCEEKGLIKGVIGKGTFVSSTAGIPHDLLTNHKEAGIIEMGMVLPVYETNEMVKTYVTGLYSSIDYDLVLKYSPPEGHIKHRYIASKWLEQYKIKSSPDKLLITSGSQNALSVILISLFKKGDRIVADEFSYTGLKSLAKLLGIILIPVKRDNRGIDIEELRTTCRREKIQGIYLIPDCHNPTTITLDMDRRKEIGKLVDEHGITLIEDGTFSFCSEERLVPISSLNPENSIYIHGTSKALNPTFRISYIVSPEKYVKQVRHGVNNITWMASPLTAEIISLLQSSQAYDAIVRNKLSILEERNRITDEILKGFDLIPSKSSLFRYLSLPEGFIDTEIENNCLKSGVQVFSAKRFSTGINCRHNAIRISIGSPKDSNELVKALEIIRTVLESRRSASET